MKGLLILVPFFSLAASFAFPTGDQIVFEVDSTPNRVPGLPSKDAYYVVLDEWLDDAKRAILKGKKNLEKWYHDGKQYIKQNELLYELVSLPSFNEHQLRVTEPQLCDPSVKQISGYLDIAHDKHLFFWFFESRNSPSTDPLVLWLNGGPGASSTFGLLFELGPCSIANEGKNTTFNPHSWISNANMIFLDQPVNVGFSYADGRTTVDTSPVAGRDVYAFLELFLSRFPKYSKQPLHISGESYAGTYLPNIARAIWTGNKQLDQGPAKGRVPRRPSLKKLNLESIIIGNGHTDPYFQMVSVADYACHGPYPVLSDPEGPECTALRSMVPTCQRMIKACYTYNSRLACVSALLYCTSQVSRQLARTGLNPYDVRRKCDRSKDGDLCYKETSYIDTWMNDPHVKVALGVDPTRTFVGANMKVNGAFFLQGDAAHNSAKLLSELVDDGIRLLIYAGNADMVCDYMGNERWLEALDSSFQGEFAAAKPVPWITTGDGKIAGTVRSAGGQGFTAGNITFVTVFEAGHMVPFDQPEAALDLFSRWISNTPLSLHDLVSCLVYVTQSAFHQFKTAHPPYTRETNVLALPPVYGDSDLVSLPLLNVCVAASIKELAAQVKLTHTYGNDANVDIEAIYAFPIPAKAAVCSFVMIKQDGTRVVGKVKETVEARETYEEAIAEGKQAALMEQQTPDGNIPPKEQVKIELIYATVLSEDEENDSIRLLLPMHIGARYGQEPYSIADFPSHNYYFTSLNTPFLEISANIETIAPISKISSPSHPVSTELGPDPALPNAQELPFSNYARISLSSESALDKDFVLTVKSAGLDAPRCIAELHPIHPTVALALTLVPRFKLPDLAKQEFIFLIDRSGSMSGARIGAAIAALVVMLRSLPAKDSLFQIASFGNSCTMLWDDGSRPYNQATLETATQHVDKMTANYGGTEIRRALQTCFEGRKTDRPTSVFVLTDGEAWDLEGVFTEVKGAIAAAPAQAYLRVFVLGIGNSASTAMCEGIARVGNGTCMMVGDQERSFTGKIARMLKAARAPLISDISMDWGVPVDEPQLIAVDATEGVDEDHEFVMVDSEGAGEAVGKGKDKGKEKQKTLDIFDQSVDPIQLDTEPVPAPPPVVLAPPPQVQQSPFMIRTLSPGNRLNVYAILQGKTIPETVTLIGRTDDGSEIRLPVPVTLSNLPNAPESPPAVHALAARTIIQDLEDGQHAITIEDPDLLARTVKASIVRLGKTFSISSSATSFVAVDESPTSTRIRHPDVVQIPMMGNTIVVARRASRAHPSGYRGRGGGRGSARVGSGKAPRMQLATSAARKTAATPVTAMRTKSRKAAAPLAAPTTKKRKRAAVEKFLDFCEVDDEEDDEGPVVPPNPQGQAALESLARHQSFDGCFSLAVLSVIQLTMDVAQARAELLDGISDEVFATIIAMAFMANKLGSDVERDSWEAMYDKARAFVDGEIQVSVDELETKAVSILA
ncbi:hypothetical protein MVEN_01673600 [Mycena venus]|uniref:Carboxypeptidase n=1 Tax=Mycena venus TaxID=2733690 RepID=A0A8H7CP92_9AGAR|nr:hypothetical protein MVEN_01673600 [Mycena venus]